MIPLDGLLTLAGTDPKQLQEIGRLARRLNKLDAERAAILARLAEHGVSEQAVTPSPPAPPSRPIIATDPPCVVCGAESDLDVDGKHYCGQHDPLA